MFLLSFLQVLLQIFRPDIYQATLQPIKYITPIVSYVCFTVWIYLEIEDLGKFNLDRSSITIIVLFGTLLRQMLGISGEIYYLIPIYISSLIIFIVAKKNWTKIPTTNKHWTIMSIVFSATFLIPLALIERVNPRTYFIVDSQNWVLLTFRSAIFNLSFVSIIEEVLFRGILWGHLRELRWSENKIFWIQALIFWMAHFTRLANPITFFISLPLTIIWESYLARNSKQTFPSIVGHTILNTFLAIIVTIFFSLD